MTDFGPGFPGVLSIDENGSVIFATAPVDPANFVTTYLLNGGSNDMGVDGSTPATFSYTVPAGKVFELARFLLYMESGTAFDSIKFMHLTALTNGVDIIANGITLTNWKDNIDVLVDMFDFSSAGATFGKTTKTMAGRWTFTRGTEGQALKVTAGNTVAAVVNDNLSEAGIIFRAKIQGELKNV